MKYTIQRDTANLLRIQNWKSVNREKKDGEAMARKRAETPQKKKAAPYRTLCR
jgi:hypothetical protein